MKLEKPGPKIKKLKSNNQQPLKLTQKQRMKVYQMFNGLCAYCGHDIEFHQMHVDHVTARSRYKNSEDADFWENLRPSCRPCNLRKNTMTVERFRKELERDIEQLKRDSAKFRLLLKYGKIKVNEEEIDFYFEIHKRGLINSE
jgi:uncharacterized protein (TIGR02646 family)